MLRLFASFRVQRTWLLFLLCVGLYVEHRGEKMKQDDDHDLYMQSGRDNIVYSYAT